jgi:hypothetical protein
MEKLIRLNIPVKPPLSPNCQTLYSSLLEIAQSNISVGKEFAKKLIPKKACWDGGRTYLHQACDRYDVVVIQLLLDAGFDIYFPDQNGITPLHEAAGYLETLKAMMKQCQCLEIKFDTSIKDKQQRIPLHRLGMRYRNMPDTFEQILQIHLSHGANINAMDANGCTPLFHACHQNHPAWEIKIWLNHDAKRNIANKVWFKISSLLFSMYESFIIYLVCFIS